MTSNSINILGMVTENTGEPEAETEAETKPQIFDCDGCGKRLAFGYIDTPPEQGDPMTIVPEAGYEAHYCPDCYTRRPEGTPYDRKDLDSLPYLTKTGNK